MARSTVTATLRVSAAATALLAWAGCGYHVGSMHPDDVYTVYVPIFKSQEYRRDLEFMLTEQVVKEIEQTTPYKVVKRPQADVELTGTILRMYKNVQSINPENDPRELQIILEASVTYRDLRTGQLRAGSSDIQAGTREIAVTQTYHPELGESITTASNRAVRKMARRIVELMEAPW